MAVTSIVFPETQEWLGIAAELTAGTVVNPVVTIPVEKAEPDEKPTWLTDKSLRGQMVSEFALIQGTEFADFSLNGPVYIDTIGHLLRNIFGDYSATGSTPTNSTTLSAQASAGATTCTVASIAGYSNGSVVQIGSGTTAEVVVLSTAPSGSTLTFANNPLRFTHASAQAVATVVAPFTHTFAVLNSGNGQPATHTLTFHQGITSAQGARSYAYFCASEMQFELNAEQLFTHSTKGMSFLGAPTAVAPVNTFTAALAQPAWEAKVGVGGPASGGTLVSDVEQVTVTLMRQVKGIWTAAGQQTPFIIARYDLTGTGGFKHLAQSETPMLNMLNSVQPQVQVVISNGLSGANLLSCTFNFQVAAYDAAKLNSNGAIEYDVTWKGIANSTNIGGSGGSGIASVILVNAVSTY